MTRRVLIVSPNFPPANGADAQRARMTIPYFEDHGWEPTVLAVNPIHLAMPQDEWLLQGIPDRIRIHRCNALSRSWSIVPGLGNLDYRVLGRMRRYGDRLLASEGFDLIYFSTTVFTLMRLGPHWKKHFRVPYVVDYQDPWVNDHYRQHPEITPPGGRLKFGVVDRLSRRYETGVVKDCDGITSVSPDYLHQLQMRYTWSGTIPSLVLPFPGAERDFDRIRSEPGSQSAFAANDGLQHWVYVGRGGPDMQFALSGFFAALQKWKAEQGAKYRRTRINFIGTSYAAAGQGTKTISPIAERYGVADIVSESTDRVPYESVLRMLLDADALIVPGSNDPAYTASKLYPYLMAEKPLLAIFHENSSVVDVINKTGGARVVTFASGTSVDDLAVEVQRNWFDGDQYSFREPLNRQAFQPYTDQASAQRLCDFFDQLVPQQKCKSSQS